MEVLSGDLGPSEAFLVPPDGVPAPSHIDATCLCVSIYLDGKPITIDGKIVDEDLKQYAEKLGR